MKGATAIFFVLPLIVTAMGWIGGHDLRWERSETNAMLFWLFSVSWIGAYCMSRIK